MHTRGKRFENVAQAERPFVRRVQTRIESCGNRERLPTRVDPGGDIIPFMKRVLASAVLIAAVAVPPVSAQPIYKYVSPGGQVTYSQTPVPGARLAEELAPAPEVSPETLDAEHARRTARDKALNEAVEKNVNSLNEAWSELNLWDARLREVQARLKAGREPRPGERTGVVYQGKSRLNEAYWARQRVNETAVAEAEAHVQHARAMIQALR
ncbi:MAG: DUF4124 domain-containing protein [Betaproteobacteria bacterium]|nr:DUF4124 domain-containing protein [Betaproteobacteria bacterium]